MENYNLIDYLNMASFGLLLPIVELCGRQLLQEHFDAALQAALQSSQIES